MAIVYGSNYDKMYNQEPKELGDAGYQHVKLRCLMDLFASAAISDECYIGELPEDAIVISAEVVGAATALTLEDDQGNAISIGDRVAARTKLVAVPAAGLTNEHILVKYLQC